MELVTIVLVSGGFLLVANVLEAALLNSLVITQNQTSVQAWVAQFLFWSNIVILCAMLTSILWWCLGKWSFKVTKPGDSDRRGMWFVLILIPVISIAVAIFQTEWPVEWGGLAYGLYAVTGVSCYYLATALGSPSSVKCTPPWSCKLRKIFRLN